MTEAAMAIPSEPEPEGLRRELRLALVMNGGVSLAVWMGGVTQELENLRTCTSSTPPEPEPAAEPKRKLAQAWRAAATAGGYSRVLVDIVAGTSAGGINGVMLATAIARGANLPSLRDLWVEEASLEVDKLLRAVPLPGQSLLDGDFFQKLLKTEIEKVKTTVRDPEDVTLLVTATALQPHVLTREASVTVSADDSRRVFRFSRRTRYAEGAPSTVTNCLLPNHSGDLARAGRASASFPVAFAPVQATAYMSEREAQKRGLAGEYLMDGGVLDNAPFEPLVEALRSRAARTPFRRTLLYVKPTSDRPIGLPDEGSRLELRRMFAPLLAASREPDARLDLETLDDCFALMQFTNCDPTTVLAHALSNDASRDTLIRAATDLRWLYRAARAQAVDVAGRDDRWLRPTAEPGDLASTSDSWLLPTSLDPLGPDGAWMWGIGTCERLLRWWSRALNAGPVTPAVVSAMGSIATAADQVGLIARQPEGERPMALAPCMTSAADEAAAGLATDLSGSELLALSLAVEVVVCALRWSDDDWGVFFPQFDYHEVTPAAPSLLDLTEANEQVEPPVSPEAFRAHWPSRKLYGERWGHFGAFASAEGRRSDWVWGRLDGASALLDLLLRDADTSTPEELATLRENVLEAILMDEDPAISSEAFREKLVADAAELYALDSQALFAMLRRGMSAPTRKAVADLVVGLPGANLVDLLSDQPTMAAMFGVLEPAPPRGMFGRVKAAAGRRAGGWARRLARRKVINALRKP